MSELVVRLIAPQRLNSLRPIYESDPDLVYKLRKNYQAVYSQPEFKIFEATNNLGLRDHELLPKKAGTYRILGLGDSFSYSNSVDLDDTFFKKTESCLSASSPFPLEIINAAVPAYSTIQELRYLEKYGIQHDPDAILLGFYVGNDFEDSYELFDSLGNPTITVKNGYLMTLGNFPSARYDVQEPWFRTATQSMRTFLATNSHLYKFLLGRFSEILWRFGLRSNPPPPDFCAKTFSKHTQNGWELVQRLLMEFKSFTDKRDIRFILLALPTQYQVDDRLWYHHFTTFRLNPDLYDLNKPRKILRDFCLEYNIEFVDVLDSMRVANKSEPLFYPIASYMTPAGHQVVADILCKYFLNRLNN